VEVAGDHSVHGGENLLEGTVVVFLKLAGPGVSNLGVVHLLHFDACLNYLGGDLVAGTDDEVVVREIERGDATFFVTCEVNPDSLGGGHGKGCGRASFGSADAGAGTFTDNIVACVLEKHFQNCGHDWRAIAVANADTENFLHLSFSSSKRSKDRFLCY